MPNRLIRALLLAGTLAAACFEAGAQPCRTVLLRSDTTAAFFRANGGDYERLRNAWRALFARHDIAHCELAAPELAAASRTDGVLIMASSVALSESDRAAIRARLAAGWSVLGTWALGVRDGRGEWSGYGLIEELFSAKAAPEVSPGKDESFLLPYGETPLTYALPAGQRIFLLQAGEPFLRVRAAHAAARFGNYMREVAHPGALLAAVAYDERQGARRAYFGFAETAWDSAQGDVDALVLGTLRWLERRPIVAKSAWPHLYRAALLLEMDTEDKFENSVRFARLLERHNIRGTFYSVTSEAQKHPAVVKRLARRHEIAYHAEVHNGFAKLDPTEQEKRLRSMLRQLSKVLPNASLATGFRAPLEQYDANTERALRAVGIRHHAASPAARDDALPGFSAAEPGVSADDALVVLPRTWLDDINLFTLAGPVQEMPKEEVLLRSLQDTLAMRSFGLLSVHTQNFEPGGALERVLGRLLQRIAEQRGEVWTPSGSAVTQWWRDREAVRVGVDERGDFLVLRLHVTRGPVAGLRLLLVPPYPRAPTLEGANDARLHQLDQHRWAIVFPKLDKGTTHLAVKF
jgi:peptidoglycan/xylan/chitin deacetylase (PgdA/CDA1 family)